MLVRLAARVLNNAVSSTSSNMPPKKKAASKAGETAKKGKAAATTTRKRPATRAQPGRRAKRPKQELTPPVPSDDDDDDAEDAEDASDAEAPEDAQAPGDVQAPGYVQAPGDAEPPGDAEAPVDTGGAEGAVAPAGAGASGDANVVEEWSDVQVLAEAHTDVRIDFREARPTLRAELQVFKDANLTSRLGYRARFRLFPGAPPKKKAQQAAADADDVPTVAYIYAFRVDKPTPARPKRAAFHRELIDLAYSEADDEVGETLLCMKAIYKKTDGGVKVAFAPRERELRQNKLIFIQTVYICDGFRQGGLLTHVLSAFNEVLGSQQLSEWYVFDGTLVLMPARPDDSHGAPWGEMTNDAVETKLIDVYRRHGQYEVWGRASVDKQGVVIMGRTIPDQAEEEGEGDDAGPDDDDEEARFHAKLI